MSSFSLLALLLGLVAVRGDETVNAGGVTAEVIGASGGIKLYGLNAADNFIMISQEKLQECTYDSSTGAISRVNGNGRSWNLAGSGSWTAFEAEQISSTTTGYHSTFNAQNGDKKFSLSVHVSITQYDVEEMIPCSNCSDTSVGECQSPHDQTCALVNTTTNNCDVNYTMCTETVTIREETLKFSTTVSGWSFANADNSLCYAVELKFKDGETLVTDDALSEFQNGKLIKASDKFIDMPTTGKHIGPDGSVDVTVPIVTGWQGSKYQIDYVFPNLGSGESFYYDPTLGSSSGAASVGASFVLVALSSILAFVGFY